VGRLGRLAAGDDLTGVCAAGHRASALAGARALAHGGTAVDAVVAAAFAAAVAESPLTGPGAGGFMLVRPPGGPAVLLDFFVAVPGLGPGGRRLRAEDLHAFTVPFGDADQVFHIGPASVAVPGQVQGLCAAWERFGRLPLDDLLEPAVRLAREGVPLTRQAGYLHRILAEMLTHTPAAADVYAPGGRLLGEGEVVRLPELADTLAELARTGPAAMRAGGALAGRVREGLEAMGGLVTAEDLAAYRVLERPPLEVAFRDVTLLTNPPPSAGGVLIAAALRALDEDPPAADAAGHYLGVARAGARANALRDDAFTRLLHEEDFLERFWAGRLGGGGAGAARRAPTGTTHVSAVDADGGMASCSSSNGSGSGVMLPGTGFLLNNMLGEEDLNPDGPGVGVPGRRMLSMMAPTLMLRHGEPVVALGSAGSNRLRSAILQTVVNIVDAGLDLPAAVRRPRVHPEAGGLDVEGGVPEAVCAALEAAGGFRLRRWGDTNLFFGGVSAAGRIGGRLQGAGDPRRSGAAAGVTRAGEVIELSTV
jgi:gamma-glutamyltranspeptidase/glutathione hydrolase